MKIPSRKKNTQNNESDVCDEREILIQEVMTFLMIEIIN
jgi:hypothetical protein